MPFEDTLVAFGRGENAEAARLAELNLAEARATGDVQAQVDEDERLL